MKKTLILKLSLLSDPKLLCVVRASVGELATTVGFEEAEVRSMVLAVDEALANVIRHGYAGDTGRPMQVAFSRGRMRGRTRGGDALEIRIMDWGVPVNSVKLRGRALEDVRPGGLGLHFINEAMDLVTFRHLSGRNYLRLVKLLPSRKPDETPGEQLCR